MNSGCRLTAYSMVVPATRAWTNVLISGPVEMAALPAPRASPDRSWVSAGVCRFATELQDSQQHVADRPNSADEQRTLGADEVHLPMLVLSEVQVDGPQR